MQFALIHILGSHELGAVDPGFGRPGGGHQPVDPGYGRPIFHPGHPDHGLPSHGHIGNQLPWAPGSIDNTLPVPPGVEAPAPIPPDLESKLVVLWHLPNTVEWHGKVIDPSLSAGYPLPPAPEPKY